MTRRRFRRDPTHALFADQSQSIPDNLVALFGRIRAWNYSAETARSAVGCSPRSGSETVASQAEHRCRPASRLRSLRSARSSSGVRFLRLTCRAADGPTQPEMTQSRPPRRAGPRRGVGKRSPNKRPNTPLSPASLPGFGKRQGTSGRICSCGAVGVQPPLSGIPKQYPPLAVPTIVRQSEQDDIESSRVQPFDEPRRQVFDQI